MGAVVRGGLPFYGFALGVVMLDNRCARPVGDVGNAATFDFPVLYDVAAGAVPRLVVEHTPDDLVASFVASAKRLVAAGVQAIGTSCGFAVAYQQDLADAVEVPVATSSLLQVPQVLRQLPASARVGVLTANATTLSERHLAAAGIDATDQDRLTIVGLEDTAAFYPAIVGDGADLDVAAVEAEVVARTGEASRRDHRIGAWVFECTNLPPYRGAVRAATGLPVYDVVTLLTWLHRSVEP